MAAARANFFRFIPFLYSLHSSIEIFDSFLFHCITIGQTSSRACSMLKYVRRGVTHHDDVYATALGFTCAITPKCEWSAHLKLSAVAVGRSIFFALMMAQTIIGLVCSRAENVAEWDQSWYFRGATVVLYEWWKLVNHIHSLPIVSLLENIAHWTSENKMLNLFLYTKMATGFLSCCSDASTLKCQWKILFYFFRFER